MVHCFELIVWVFSLSAGGSGRSGLWVSPGARVLSEAELLRADRFHFEGDRLRYLYFHATMRRLLASCLPSPATPESLVFGEGERGKPFLRDFPELHFNLTHSKETAALAVTRSGPVGVDLERLDRQFPAMEIARNYFAEHEVAALESAITDAERADRFFRLWTAKEAVMKLTGLGMALEPPQIKLALDPTGRAVGFRSVAGFPDAPAAWKLHSFQTANGALLSVVADRSVAKVEVREHDTPLATPDLLL